MKRISILWEFSRPHTIIGTTLSVLTLFCLARNGHPYTAEQLPVLLITLLVGLCTNIYITGLNQCTDVDVDLINKPWLPIPAGDLSKKGAIRIVWIVGIIALLASAYLSLAFCALIFVIMAIGTAYSLPPLNLKRNHIAAASAISIVRGVLVNIGFYIHFRYQFFHDASFNPVILPLVVFITSFSIGIAWFKDIPDTEGDAQYDFGTLALSLGRKRALQAGMCVVSFGYLSVIASAFFNLLPSGMFLIITHVLALSLFLIMGSRLDLQNDSAIKRFYMIFWGLFFLEYILFAIAFTI
jgi:homogentisate phytyltransferase/homogentisate geranylgeranyltransferase